MELNGILAPLPTPFTDDGSSISEIRLARVVRRLQEFGVSGYVACGHVGEFAAIGYSERKSLVEVLFRCIPISAQVIVNVSTLSTTASLDLAQHAARHGARACVIMPPFYGCFTETEILNFLRVVGQYAGLPVIVVDPHGAMDAEMRAEIDNVTGIFRANPTFWSVKAIGPDLQATADEFSLDPGAATILATLTPAERLMRQPEGELQKLARFVCMHGKARVIKAAFELFGTEVGPLRGPRLPLPDAQVEQLRALLDLVGTPE